MTAYFIKMSVIAFAATSLVSVVYVWFIPKFFPDYRTYLFLNLGVACAGLLGGWHSYLYFKPTMALMMNLLLSASAAAIASALTLYFSMLLILNLRGS